MASNNEGNSEINSTLLNFANSLGTDECESELDKECKARNNEQAPVEASAIEDMKQISELLTSGISVDAVENNKLLYYASKNCMTPLQFAAVNGHDDCLDILIKHGADVNAKDRFDVTALHMAAEKGFFSCVKTLLNAGADCCSPIKYSKRGCSNGIPYLRGTTPLHLAAANNHIDCCKVLIDFGADYNAIDEDGCTSLFIAAREGFSSCMLTHLRHDVAKNILSLPDFKNDTPLHFAVHHQMLDCIRELLKLGADVNHMNEFGLSPLHIALIPPDSGLYRCNTLSEMLILEGYNTDVNLKSGRYTPLHYVCFDSCMNNWRRQPQLAMLLIKYGANVNIKNTTGFTLLQCEIASLETNYDVLKYIVRSVLFLPRMKDLKLFSAMESPAPSGIGNLDLNLENILDSYKLFFEENPLRIPWKKISRDEYAIVSFVVRQFTPYKPFHEQHMMSSYDAYEGRTSASHEMYVPNYGNERDWVPHVIEKLLWYKQMASRPRTLQHCCRFAIRKAVGYRRLKHVEKLPIPLLLQSYILLQSD